MRDDQHPVAIVSGADIVNVLKQRGLSTVPLVLNWLGTEFPAVASQRSDVGFGSECGVEVPALVPLPTNG